MEVKVEETIPAEKPDQTAQEAEVDKNIDAQKTGTIKKRKKKRRRSDDGSIPISRVGSVVDRFFLFVRQKTMTVGSCMYSNFGSFI